MHFCTPWSMRNINIQSCPKHSSWTCRHSWSLKSISPIVSEATCAGSVTSREHCKMLRFLWQGLYNTAAWRPHTAPRDPGMRVNKPGASSLTPCVAMYSADWWENKVGSSMINTWPFSQDAPLRLYGGSQSLIWWLPCKVNTDLDQNDIETWIFLILQYRYSENC